MVGFISLLGELAIDCHEYVLPESARQGRSLFLKVLTPGEVLCHHSPQSIANDQRDIWAALLGQSV
jgi:hypothetical protein